MKNAVRNHWRPLVVGLLIGVIVFRNIWTWLPQHTYRTLITGSDILSALDNGNDNQIAALAQTYHYDYQIFQKNHLVYSSNPRLPTVRLIQTPLPSPGVIVNNIQTQLSAMQPYQAHIAFHRYIFFSVASTHSTKQAVYVVYRKVL
jgi:hypothetical protein